MKNFLRIVRDLNKLGHFGDRDRFKTGKMPHIASDSPSPVSPTKSRQTNRPFVVSIEGNIGAGKSTMLKFFESYTDVELIPEPVAQWCDVNGHNLLGKLYEDPKR